MRRLLATLLVLLAAIYLHLHLRGVQRNTKDDKNIYLRGVQRNSKDDKNIFHYINGYSPNITAYVEFLNELRSRLASGTAVHGIAVTRPATDVPLQERFIQVVLEIDHTEDPKSPIITVIIDTVNVYVVGYHVGRTVRPTLHYLNDIPEEALFQAFPSTQYTHRRLGFRGNYRDLPRREDHELGHGALNDAIRNLYHGQSQPSALLVIIQMVAEAVRIRYIEHRIRRNMLGQNLNFIPDPRVISMENRWSDLSQQFQCSDERGLFPRTIEVRSVLNEVINISNVAGFIRQAALALMLYQYKPNAIRMPVPVAVGADEDCPDGEPITNIIGRDEQCLDVKDRRYEDGNPIVLWECGNAQYNQLWTFKSDGTIRSNGKCLTTHGYTSGDSIVIFDCDCIAPEATQWILSSIGTIMNPKSGLVITAGTAGERNELTVTVAEDINYSMQAWSAGNYTQPTINYISGFRERCLQAGAYDGSPAFVWLANCVIGTEPSGQEWALYGDSTIRLYTDRTLCVTSYNGKSLDKIVLIKCKGWNTQRWIFKADGTILDPLSGLVMDVRESDVSLHEIILYQPTGNPNQKWFAF